MHRICRPTSPLGKKRGGGGSGSGMGMGMHFGVADAVDGASGERLGSLSPGGGDDAPAEATCLSYTVTTHHPPPTTHHPINHQPTNQPPTTVRRLPLRAP